MLNRQNFAEEGRQPIFNLPPVIVMCLAVLFGIHLGRMLLLSSEADFDLVLRFAFIPLRVLEPEELGSVVPGGPGAALWSFVTYAFLHADWTHVVFNGLWLAAFGAPLAWRFGTSRFLLFSLVGAVAGAVLHLAVNLHDIQPMIGASAAISAQMAGASRFVFSAGGPLGGLRGPGAFSLPAAPLKVIMRDRNVLIFLGIWFGLNILFGVVGMGTAFGAQSIAWEAHIGGFIAGLLTFSLFDPVDRR
jgi:membrane associated rhomboid family serine protease